MAAGDGHGGATSTAGCVDGLQQQRPAGDGLAMLIGVEAQTDSTN
jgi:hypothetical protein